MGEPTTPTPNTSNQDTSENISKGAHKHVESRPAETAPAETAHNDHSPSETLAADALPTDALHNQETATDKDLQALRELILGTSLEKAIRSNLSPEALSQALPAALTAAYDHQAGITLALTPTVEQAIQSSVQNDSSKLAEALFPVIGPATRKSITSAIGSLVESLNKTLEHSLSLESFKWRLEAKRTGKTFAEIVLIRTLIYQVEQAFLIHKESGLVIQHIVTDTATAQDPDLVSAMLTAIQDFVKDSFAVNANQSLDTLKLGDFTLFIESGPQAVLASVIRGTAPQELRSIMRSQLEKIHYQFGPALRKYDGDQTQLADTAPYLQECFQAKFKGSEKKKPKKKQPLSKTQKILAWCLAGFVASGLGVWAWANWQSNRHWRQFVRELQQEPGLVVIDHFKQGNTYYLQGLRDPLADEPQTLLATSKLNPDKVELEWHPYMSLDPEFLQSRVHSLLSPPATVALDLDANGVLNISGRATAAWIALAQKSITQLEGITDWNDTGLVSFEQEELNRLRDRIEHRRFDFAAGKAILRSERYEQTLQNQAQDVKALLKTAKAIEQSVMLTIHAHGDQRGSQPETLQLANTRARYIKKYLADQGIQADILSVKGQAILPNRTAINLPITDEDSIAYVKVQF